MLIIIPIIFMFYIMIIVWSALEKQDWKSELSKENQYAHQLCIVCMMIMYSDNCVYLCASFKNSGEREKGEGKTVII